jgi:hypothetical protein
VKLLDILFEGTKARKEMSTMLDRAVTESRDLTLSEQIRFDALGIRLAEVTDQLERRAVAQQMTNDYAITLVKKESL